MNPTRCPWCKKPIEVKSRTIVRKATKLTSKPKAEAMEKVKGKDRIEVVAPPAKTKAGSKAKSKK